MKRIILAVGLAVFLILIFLGGLGVFPIFGNTKMNQGHIHLHKTITLPARIPPLKRQTLIFFGYVGCTDICTPRLHEIASIAQEYKQTSPHRDLDLLFINLDTELPSAQADAFAKNFHPDFRGITLPRNELMRVTLAFNASFSKSLLDKHKINHSQHLYMLRKECNQHYYINNIYVKTPYDTKSIVHDLIEGE